MSAAKKLLSLSEKIWNLKTFYNTVIINCILSSVGTGSILAGSGRIRDLTKNLGHVWNGYR